MSVPDYQSYMTPMLGFLSDGQERRITEIAGQLAADFQLSEQDLEEKVPSGKKTRHYDRVGWAATYLKQAGLLMSPKRAFYRITDRGLAALHSGDQVNTEYLRRFPEFLQFQTRERNHDTSAAAIPPTNPLTPSENLASAYQVLRNTLEDELLERLLQASPQLFEGVVLDVLLAMGYGGSRPEAARRIGQSGDGGIDGIINEDRLGLDVIYLQAKRWQNPVGAPSLRNFVGSLTEKKATKGIFITTSEFTRDALDYVNSIDKRIILINGSDLAQYMIDFSVGVLAQETYIIKKLNENYFSEE